MGNLPETNRMHLFGASIRPICYIFIPSFLIIRPMTSESPSAEHPTSLRQERSHLPQRNLNWDALKALLLLVLFVNHLKRYFPDLAPVLGVFTAPFGYFSMFAPFVLISGMTTGVAIVSSESATAARRRLWIRAGIIYLLHLSLLLLILVTINAGNPELVHTDPLTELVQHPYLLSLGIMTLSYGPHLMDVLPVYFLLLCMAGAVAPLFRRKHAMGVVVFASFLIWFALQFNIPGEQTLFKNFRSQNPFGFQFLFVLGMAYGALLRQGRFERKERRWQTIIRGIDIICIPVVVWFFLIRHKIVPSGMTAAFSNSLFYPPAQLPIGIIINTVAFARVMSLLGSLNYGAWPVIKQIGHWVGRNSLSVFWWNIALFYLILPWRSYIAPLSPEAQWCVFAAALLSVSIPLLVRHRVWPALRRATSPITEQDQTLLSLYQDWRQLLFLGVIALLPITYAPGLGIEYRHIKHVTFWLFAGLFGWQLSRKLFRSASPAASRIVLLCPLILIAVNLLSSVYAANAGQAFERSALLAAAGVFFLLVIDTPRISVRQIALALAFPLFVAATLILLRAYAGIILVPVGSGLGGLIGERNSAAIFMAASLPALISWWTFAPSSILVRRTLPPLLILLLLCIAVSRCRSSWLMVLMQTGAYALLWWHSRRENTLWRRAFFLQIGTTACAVLVLLTVPQTLNWSSPTAYKDTLTHLLSPSHANGRIDLWRVGLQMAKERPLSGFGAGNYVVSHRSYVPSSGADPAAFGYLRNDLPLFNDFLQSFAETGVLGGSLFLLVFLAFPLLSFGKNLKTGGQEDLVLASLCCLSLALAACFDYPFNRAESLLLFAVLAAIIARSQHTGGPQRTLWIPVTIRLISTALITLALLYGTSFTLRKIYNERQQQTGLLKTAFILWPWDALWTNYDAMHFESRGDRRFTDQFVAARLSDWPEDPRSYLARAEVARMRGKLSEAAADYERALFEVPGGRCSRTTRYILGQMRQSENSEQEMLARRLLPRCSS